MSSEILLKFAKKGFNLSPAAYSKILESNDPLTLTSSIIVKLKSSDLTKDDFVSVNEDIIEILINGENVDNLESKDIKSIQNQNKPLNKAINNDLKISKEVEDIENNGIEIEPEKTIKNRKPETEPKIENNIENNNIKTEPEMEKPQTSIESELDESEEDGEFDASKIRYNPGTDAQAEKIADIKNIKDNHKICRRNMEESNVEYDFEILQDTSNKSYTSGEIGNLISYFRSRYEKEAEILSKRPELRVYQKIEDISDDQTDLALILMVNEIRTTKKGHKLIEFEDETGTIPILFSKDNTELYNEAEKLVKDEVVGILASKMQGSGNQLAIGNQIIHPGVPRIPQKEMDFGIVFLSDVHIGSKTFLPEAFERFIMWINGEYGNEEQVRIANDVKYLIIGGDIVDGIGVYPNQEKELEIKDIRQQYDKAASYLGQIRSDIKIIITPGNHDASRVAEPQPAVPVKYAKSLYELNNVEFISNPGYVSLDGIKV